ncbi:MAG: hypothetical protein ACK58O_08030, partial [Brevundimonas sp.]
MVAAGGGEQLRQAARFGLQPAEAVLGGAGVSARCLFGRRQLRASGLGGLQRLAGRGEVSLGSVERALRRVKLRRRDRAEGRSLGLGGLESPLGAPQPGVGVATAGGVGGEARLD